MMLWIDMKLIMLVVWCPMTKVNANSSEILMNAKVLSWALISACVVQLSFSIITVNYHHDIIILIFSTPLKFSKFPAAKNGFHLHYHKLWLFNKNNSMQTLMLNCPFKIFLLPRLCWSALSFIYDFLLLSQSLPSLHATFQRKEKMEDIFTHSLTFYLEVLFSACSPFSIFFFYLESLKWKGERGKKGLLVRKMW